MHCSKCGTLNPEGASFCSKCGTALSAAGVSPAEGASERSASSGKSFDEEAWSAAIGPSNTDYYLSRFRTQYATGKRSLWHWPALFVTFYWLLYRKAWVGALIYFFLPSIIFMVVGVAVAAISGKSSVIGGLLSLLCFGAIILGPPLMANSIYYAQCKELIHRERFKARSREHFLAALEAKGGTSNIAVVVIAIFALVFFIGILAAVALPAYQDYTKRAKSSEAIISGMSVARAVGEQYQRTGQLPMSLDPFLAISPPSRYITDMRLRQENGVVEMTLSFGPNAGGGLVYLVPARTEAGAITWTCKSEAAMKRFVPQSCRGEQGL